METKVSITTTDGFLLPGVLRTEDHVPNKGLIIFVHGLTGFSNEHIFYNGARYFAKHGYASFRFDYYPGTEDGGRTLRASTLASHVDDLTTVIDHFSNDYKNIFLIGHSLGGLTILLANDQRATAAVLWDPSCSPDGKGLTGILSDVVAEVPALKAKVVNWGVEYLLGMAMVKEFQNVPIPQELLRSYKIPTKVIVAGKGVLVDGAREYFAHLPEPKAQHLVEGASHCFDEEGTEEELHRETLNWLEGRQVNYA